MATSGDYIFNVVQVDPENEIDVAMAGVTQFLVSFSPSVTGSGLTLGGTTGQILRKNSSTNFDASWSSSFFGPKDVTNTPGNRATNALSFNVIMAAEMVSLTVTNTSIGPNSNIQISMGTDDSSMSSVKFVKSTGSMAIYPDTPPTDGPVTIDCLIIN